MINNTTTIFQKVKGDKGKLGGANQAGEVQYSKKRAYRNATYTQL